MVKKMSYKVLQICNPKFKNWANTFVLDRTNLSLRLKPVLDAPCLMNSVQPP